MQWRRKDKLINDVVIIDLLISGQVYRIEIALMAEFNTQF